MSSIPSGAGVGEDQARAWLTKRLSDVLVGGSSQGVSSITTDLAGSEARRMTERLTEVVMAHPGLGLGAAREVREANRGSSGRTSISSDLALEEAKRWTERLTEVLLEPSLLYGGSGGEADDDTGEGAEADDDTGDEGMREEETDEGPDPGDENEYEKSSWAAAAPPEQHPDLLVGHPDFDYTAGQIGFAGLEAEGDPGLNLQEAENQILEAENILEAEGYRASTKVFAESNPEGRAFKSGKGSDGSGSSLSQQKLQVGFQNSAGLESITLFQVSNAISDAQTPKPLKSWKATRAPKAKKEPLRKLPKDEEKNPTALATMWSTKQGEEVDVEDDENEEFEYEYSYERFQNVMFSPQPSCSPTPSPAGSGTGSGTTRTSQNLMQMLVAAAGPPSPSPGSALLVMNYSFHLILRSTSVVECKSIFNFLKLFPKFRENPLYGGKRGKMI